MSVQKSLEEKVDELFKEVGLVSRSDITRANTTISSIEINTNEEHIMQDWQELKVEIS